MMLSIKNNYTVQRFSNIFFNKFIKSFLISLHTNSSLNDIYEIKTEDEFRIKVMRSVIPVIVSFHADWCEPCLAMRPLLKKMAMDNWESLHLAEIFVDDNIELLQCFEVTAVPAVIAIKKGIVVDKFIGLVSQKKLQSFVDDLLKPS